MYISERMNCKCATSLSLLARLENYDHFVVQRVFIEMTVNSARFPFFLSVASCTRYLLGRDGWISFWDIVLFFFPRFLTVLFDK